MRYQLRQSTIMRVFPRRQRVWICTIHGWSFALILALDSAPCLYTQRRELVLAAQLFLRGARSHNGLSHNQPTRTDYSAVASL